MTRQEAEHFCDDRKAAKDVWVNKDTGLDRLSLSYWYWHDKKCFRVFEVASTLEEAVAQCVDAEGDIKAGKPKLLKPPAPTQINTSTTIICNSCSYTNYVTTGSNITHYCNSCGCPLV